MSKLRFTMPKKYVNGRASNLFLPESRIDKGETDLCDLCVKPFLYSDPCALNVIGTESTDWEMEFELPDFADRVSYPAPRKLAFDIADGPITLVNTVPNDLYSPDDVIMLRPSVYSNDDYITGGEFVGTWRLPLVFKNVSFYPGVINENGGCIAVKTITNTFELGGWSGTYSEVAPGSSFDNDAEMTPHYRHVTMRETISSTITMMVFRQNSPLQYGIRVACGMSHGMYVKSARILFRTLIDVDGEAVGWGAAGGGGQTLIEAEWDRDQLPNSSLWQTPLGTPIPASVLVPSVPGNPTDGGTGAGFTSGATYYATGVGDWITNGITTFPLDWSGSGTPDTVATVIPGTP